MLTLCCNGPSAPERVVAIPEAEFAAYWGSLERRADIWFGYDIELLPGVEVLAAVTVVEVPHEYIETCAFDSRRRKIRIGDDKWESGCVPHELGHAALFLMGHPCWDGFEHPGETPEKCEGR